MLRESVFLIFSILVAPGCGGKVGIEGASCNASADCEAALQCMQNVCVDPDREAPPGSEPEPEPEPEPVPRPNAPTPPEEPVAPKVDSDPVSTHECRAFARKVVELTIQSRGGEATEMTRSMIQAMVPEMGKCLSRGSKDEIRCTLDAHSLEDLEQCSSGCGTGTRRDPDYRGGVPSELSCRAFADKVMTLMVQGQERAAAGMMRSILEEMKPEMIKECMEGSTKAEIDGALRTAFPRELETLGDDDPC